MIRKARKYCFLQWLEGEDRGLAGAFWAEVFWRRAWYLFRFLDESLPNRG